MVSPILALSSLRVWYFEKSIRVKYAAHISAALIFYYGAVLAASRHYSIADILTVFTMLLFSIANANAIIAFSRFFFSFAVF